MSVAIGKRNATRQKRMLRIQPFWILQKHSFLVRNHWTYCGMDPSLEELQCTWAVLKTLGSIIERKQTSFYSPSIPNFFPNKSLTSCRTHISLNTIWRKILWGVLRKHWLAALGPWVWTWRLGWDRWNTQLFVNQSSLWLQIRPDEMTENCFWIKANENKYENVDLLCKLENTFCCQQKGKFNILFILVFWHCHFLYVNHYKALF